MKNMKFFLTLFLSNLLFLNSTACYGYYINLNAETENFFNKKIQKFLKTSNGQDFLGYVNRHQANLFETIIKQLRGFNQHNDRDETDCCRACYYIKLLHDKQFKFSQENKKTILTALQILTTWFIRNSPLPADMDEAEALFRGFDFKTLFIENPTTVKPSKTSKHCTIL